MGPYRELSEATVLRAEAFLEDPKPANSVADIYGRVVDRMSQVEQMHPEAEAVRLEIRADDDGVAAN